MRSTFVFVVVFALFSVVSSAPVADTLEPLNFAIVGNPTPDTPSAQDVHPREPESSNFRISGNPTGDSGRTDQARRSNFAIVGNPTPDSSDDQ